MGLFSKLFGGGSKGSSVPSAPSFQPDPNLAWSQDNLKKQYDYLINGLTTGGGNLSGLMGDTISFNPMTTQLALDKIKAQLAPSYRQSRQDTVNQLEANNQLTGSTTASALGNLEADYLSQLTAATAEAGLQDINRALANRVGLYATGLETGRAVGGNALQNQSQMNSFALANYENQVAQALMNQPDATGGLGGGISGAIGGGLQGFAMTGSPWGAAIGAGLGGFAGYQGSPETGGGIMSMGAGSYGQKAGFANQSALLGQLINSGSAPKQEAITYSLNRSPYSLLSPWNTIPQ